MNRARVAELLRELADEFEAEDVVDRDVKPENRAPRAKAFPPPLHPVSDTDRQRAKAMLRRRGIRP